MVELVEFDGVQFAMIIRANFAQPGIHFVTPNDYSQQMAFMKYPSGKVIKPHIHNYLPRAVNYTQEVLFIRKGKLRVDFYDNKSRYLESRLLSGGDVMLLATGGHGFEALEDLEMIEVKQGPYGGEADVTRFDAVEADKLKTKV